MRDTMSVSPSFNLARRNITVDLHRKLTRRLASINGACRSTPYAIWFLLSGHGAPFDMTPTHEDARQRTAQQESSDVVHPKPQPCALFR